MTNIDDFVASVNRLENLIDSNQADLKRDVESLIGPRFCSLKDEVNKLKSAHCALDQINNLMALWDDRHELSDLPNRIRAILEGVNNQTHHLDASEVGDNVTVEPTNNRGGNELATKEQVDGIDTNAPFGGEELNDDILNETLHEESNGTNQVSMNDQQVDRSDEPANDCQNESSTSRQSKTRKRRRANKSLATECSLTSVELTTAGPMTKSKRTRLSSSLNRQETAEQLSTGSRVDLCESDHQTGIDSRGEREKGVEQSGDEEMLLDSETELSEDNQGGNYKIKIIKMKCTEENCNAEVVDNNKLHDHLRGQHRISPYRCLAKGCNERFEKWNGDGLGLHVQHNHSNISTWQCVHCTKKYRTHHHLYVHLYLNHFEGQFQCGYVGCDYDRVATFRSEILNHQISVHPKTSVYTCTFNNCGRSFNTMGHFNRHQQIHSGIKAFRCDWIACGKSFAQKTDLEAHQRIHQNVKPYKCTWNNCGYATAQSGTAIQHIRTQHFHLPASQKEQHRLGIEDNRNPREYLLKE